MFTLPCIGKQHRFILMNTFFVFINVVLLLLHEIFSCISVFTQTSYQKTLIVSLSEKVNVCMISWSTLFGCLPMLEKIATCTCWRMDCCCGLLLLRTLLIHMMLFSISMTTWCHCWNSLRKILDSVCKSQQLTHCSALSNSLQSKWYYYAVVFQIFSEKSIFLFFFMFFLFSIKGASCHLKM